MDRSSIGRAVLVAWCGAASAQSAVTPFGILDVAARAAKNGDGSTVESLASDGLAVSRPGHRGEEDVGSGLNASFRLEAGRDAGPGTAAQSAECFNRRSTLSERTALGADAGRIRNRGRSQLPTPGGTTTGSSFGTMDDRDSTASALGVRHSF